MNQDENRQRTANYYNWLIKLISFPFKYEFLSFGANLTDLSLWKIGCAWRNTLFNKLNGQSFLSLFFEILVRSLTFLKMTPLRDAFIRMPITYSLKLLWCTATLFITTIISINTAHPQSRLLSGLSDISVEINTPRKKGCRNRPTESISPAKEITNRSLRERTFKALFHNLGSFSVSLWSLRSFIHCDWSCFVNSEVVSSSCNGQKSDCSKGRWFPVLNKSFVHQKSRKEIMFAFLCGCVEASCSPPSIIFLKKRVLST